MSASPRVVRLIAGLAALAAGLAMAASQLLGFVFPTADDVACNTGPSYAVNAVDLVKFTAIGIAIVMLARVARGRLTRAGRSVAVIAAVASIVTGVANGVEHCAHLEALGLLYVLGLVVSIFATAGFGVFLARTGALPAWIGWVVTAGVLVFLLRAEQGGREVYAIAWMVVGVGLLVGALRAPHRDPRAQ
ncbi:MAG: hypothetical protein WEE36_09220 [Acidimicrobiia bacterium]